MMLLAALVPAFGAEGWRALASAVLTSVAPTAAHAGDDCKNAADGTPCPDGDLCNGDETCLNGLCSAGGPLDCSDLNGCTDDLCDSVLGCVHVNNSAGCSDGNVCTTSDTCNGGKCVGGPPNVGCLPCDAAATIPAAGGTFTGTTSGTSSLSGTCGSDGGAPERVYRFTPHVSGQVVMHTCSDGTLFNTRLYVFAATCPGTVLACNNDTSGCATGAPSSGDGSKLMLSVTAGQTYYIVVDGFAGQRGAYTLFVGTPTVCGNGTREGGSSATEPMPACAGAGSATARASAPRRRAACRISKPRSATSASPSTRRRRAVTWRRGAPRVPRGSTCCGSV